MKAPLIIAHRGASGYRPEHTEAAYLLAIAQGADYIEPDLVVTKDGVLVVRHENEISGTTDVKTHPEFADRKTEKTIDGQVVSGWFTEDFSFEELKTLRARERLPALREESAEHDGKWPILSFEEVVSLAKRESQRTGRSIGVCPETKHPSYFSSIDLPIEPRLLNALDKAGWNHKDAPVCIQSFETKNLKELAQKTKVPLVQLVWREAAPADGSFASYADMLSAASLAEIASYAAILSPEKSLILSFDEGGEAQKKGELVELAHRAGLKVIPYTFRQEKEFLLANFRGTLADELELFLAAGVDGVFTDFPALAAEARTKFQRR